MIFVGYEVNQSPFFGGLAEEMVELKETQGNVIKAGCISASWRLNVCDTFFSYWKLKTFSVGRYIASRGDIVGL